MTSFNRNIPEGVKNQLCKEVNYGCPVDDCGIPFLTFHHFEPTYAELKTQDNPKHNPEGIIALCHVHADQADGKGWTDDQLREMKKKPFLTENIRTAQFPYKRDEIVVQAGNLVYDVGTILELDGEQSIGFEMNDEGKLCLNMLIRDKDNNIILQMKKNVWTVFTDQIFNMKCPPQGRELEIWSNDKITNFRIRYDELTLDELESKLKSSRFSEKIRDELFSNLKNKDKILLLTLTGQVNYRGRPIIFTENTFGYPPNINMAGSYFQHTHSFKFQNGNFIMSFSPGSKMISGSWKFTS